MGALCSRGGAGDVVTSQSAATDRDSSTTSVKRDPRDDPRRLVLSPNTWTATTHHTGALDEKYQLISELGRGGFGQVNKVERRADGVTLAVKSCMQPTERLLEEATLWEEVSTPYHIAILQLVEVVRAVDGLHLVTELMPYGELYDALDSIVFSEQACRMVTVQVASALAHLHLRHKVAHCDVKPANVLCRQSDPTLPGSLKLSDYGFCQRFASRSTPSFTVSCGTLDYFAPELAACYRNTRTRSGLSIKYGPSVDCWALGAMVYELLHGEPPFFAPRDDELQLELIEKHELNFPAESFGQVSEDGKTFIRGMLTGDINQRLYIEDAIRHPWLQPVSDESLRAELSSAMPDSTIERRKQRASVARRRLRVSALKVMALRRLSDASVSSDAIREALHAQQKVSGESATAATGGVLVAPPTSTALKALEAQEAKGVESPIRSRRLSDTSTVSYKSDDMAPRSI